MAPPPGESALKRAAHFVEFLKRLLAGRSSENAAARSITVTKTSMSGRTPTGLPPGMKAALNSSKIALVCYPLRH